MESFEFDSSDLENTEEFLSRAYTKMQIGSDAEGARTRVTRDVMGSVGLDKLEFGCNLSIQADVIDTILVCTLEAGSMVRQHFPDGEEGRFGAGDVFLYTPHDQSYAGVNLRAHCHLLTLDPQLLTKVAAGIPGRRPGPVRLTGDRPVTPAAGRRLRNALFHLREAVRTDPGLPGHELLVSTASQYMAANVLQTFPNTALTDPTIEDRRDAHPATLRRAVAFIDEHAQEDLSVAGIAAAVHVSVRTLQFVFRRHLDTTPMSYLRRVRLAHAHDELLAADPTTGVTVTAVAARWGFLQPGRFAVAYRTAYGCPPHSTLHDRSS